MAVFTGAVKNATTRAVKKTGIEANAMKATMTGGMYGLALFMYGTSG